ncbi:class I SAM-dependent DNA methyltransferase [Bacillus alkalicellulosilyticus]|uniref:class I SAM-dependent DNA methyltransferase n=1 Tax=Alkalihalobacterium alkalicellulosilyticum TaxID=1912214 RepID=UPI00099852DC|nr:class I SAM-dependent methyltransferase [Bacillus alkalicellulosilyticus]
MSYQKFAYLYDQLMIEAPYEQWLEFTEKNIPATRSLAILDVGCGTGEFIIKLKEAGYHDVSGVDLSGEMLTVANDKLGQSGYQVPLFEMDMRNLEQIGPFDVITVFCDSLNYLELEEDVKKALNSFYSCLKDDGILLFDVHSLYKVNSFFINQTFAYDGEDISYIWQSFKGEHEHSVEHELSFFVKDDKVNLYEKFIELHLQRTFPVKTYENCLSAIGFKDISISADFTDAIPTEKSERIFFVAKK